MATSKTLTPTNVTIQIPAFTDQPDQRVNSNCIDKEADAINALNSKIGSYKKTFSFYNTVAGNSVSSGNSFSFVSVFNKFSSETIRALGTLYCLNDGSSFNVVVYNNTEAYAQADIVSGNTYHFAAISLD